jgi:uncharacterized protein YoxC
MDFLLYASALIAALSLLLIAIFVVITLKSAKQTMGEVSETLKRVENKIGGITKQSEQLLEKTNQIAQDAEVKMKNFESLSTTAKDLTETTNYMNQSFKQISDQVANPPKKYSELMQQTNVITEVAARLYYGFKREKEKRR